MDIATTRVEPHEIAKNEDFEFGFQSIIRNTAILDRMLMSASIDYIAGGRVRPVPGTMTFTVDSIWANGRSIELPAYRDQSSDPVAVLAPEMFPRFDIVQVRGTFEEFDTQRRAFYDPELQVAQYHNINTKNRLIVDIQVKQGNEGVDYAPDADTGYVKIAEIYLDPETVSLTQDNIRNVTATFQGEGNPGWTSEKNRTFIIGSMSDVWAAFIREHYADGRHREAVIKASNILLGIAEDALKSSSISVGQNLNTGDLSLLATKTILEALATIGQTLQGGTANTLLKRLSMMLTWKNNETYQPYMPTFYQGRIYYANPSNLPMMGESPGSAPVKWINAAGDVVYLPPIDGRLYGMRNRNWAELNTGDAIEALKFYSKKSIMFTNARFVDRRLRGWDLGIPYLSGDHRVYHFDTDTNDQNQQSNIVIDHDGEPPVLMGKEDHIEGISFEPAVLDLVPFEMMGKSIFGAFSILGQLEPQNAMLEMWMRIFVAENSTLLRLGTQAQDLLLLIIGGTDPEYSINHDGDIPYSIADSTDGLIYCIAKTSGNTLFHDWGNGTETINLDEEGVVMTQGTWLHIAMILKPDAILFFIGDKQFAFQRMRPIIDPLPFIINEEKTQFNLDELSIITGVTQTIEEFAENTEGRVPYSALSYKEKYAVVMVDDPAKLRTNIFESDQFKEAVQAIIAGN